MSESALIRGDAGELRLEILGYENPHATNVDDRNWLQARLEITGGPFSGSIELAITAFELAGLHQQLAEVTKSLIGSIRFETMESNWLLNLDFERTGTAVVSGMVIQNQAESNSLQYEFRTDGITLEGMVRDLGKMVAEFPVRQAIHTVHK
jgi:hypothetical protein